MIIVTCIDWVNWKIPFTYFDQLFDYT